MTPTRPSGDLWDMTALTDADRAFVQASLGRPELSIEARHRLNVFLGRCTTAMPERRAWAAYLLTRQLQRPARS